MKYSHFREYLEEAVVQRGTVRIPIETTGIWVQQWLPGHSALGDIRFTMRDQLYDDLYEAYRNEKIPEEIPSSAAQAVPE